MLIPSEMSIQADAAATLVIQLGYRGSSFAGYAEQPFQRTVAGELRRALETFLRREVDLSCAGRTDAGVHALSQYVSLPVTGDELQLSAVRLRRGLEALTPDDISIRKLFRAQAGFSARFDALERHYRYRLALGFRPVHGWEHVWWLRNTPSLNIDAMRAGAVHLLGEHDFVSFCKASSAAAIHADGRSTHRRVSVANIASLDECGDALVAIDIAANAFLHNMVRVIVGTLVEVGRGKRDPHSIGEILAARRRLAAGPTAPACGLTLQDVDYPEGSLTIW